MSGNPGDGAAYRHCSNMALQLLMQCNLILLGADQVLQGRNLLLVFLNIRLSLRKYDGAGNCPDDRAMANRLVGVGGGRRGCYLVSE